MKRFMSGIFLLAVLAFFMTGCSTVRLVDSDVTAFSRWNTVPPGPGTAYRFERLPSQQAIETRQDEVEAIARTALAKVGLQLNSTVARYSVQVVINTQVVDRGRYNGFGSATPGIFLGAGNFGASLGLSFPISLAEPYYKRELTVLMRDLNSNQVVFETRAVHDGVWADTLAVLPAMLDAALRGFPQPVPGTRRINIEIPR